MTTVESIDPIPNVELVDMICEMLLKVQQTLLSSSRLDKLGIGRYFDALGKSGCRTV